MTVGEMIEALQALEMPDALVMRNTRQDYPRVFAKRGDNWDILWVRQRKETLAPSQWFEAREGEDLHNDVDTFVMAVVI